MYPAHGNSNHLRICCFLGEGEGDLVRLKGVRSSGALRLKDDDIGEWLGESLLQCQNQLLMLDLYASNSIHLDW